MGRHRERHGVVGPTKLAELFAALSTAIDMYHDMAMTFWLPATEAALAELEGR
jgi:hypothetical protein